MLVERLPAIVYEAEPGPEGLWLYVSGFVETLLGYTPEEWRADPALWARSLHDDDRDAVLAAEDRLTAGERIAIEYRMHARDGSLVWVRDESARVLDEQGRLLVEGILTDITERKASEDRLQHLADHDGADRPAQPPPLHRGARAGDRRHAPRDALQRRDRARHRRLQVRQRLARPPGRRRADPRRRAHARRPPARQRRDRAARRRRVRLPAARHERRGGRRRRGRARRRRCASSRSRPAARPCG